MITDEMLDEYRVKGTKVRVIRDINEINDVLGIVLAWDDQTVLIRKMNRKVLKLNRNYTYLSADESRPEFIDL